MAGQLRIRSSQIRAEREKMIRPTTSHKAISPIIATLLLILIAIAAGVVVYAYVLGFVGSNTNGTGSAQAQISIDTGVIASGVAAPGTTAQAVTVYLHNEGTTQATFGIGTMGSIKGSVDGVFSTLALGVLVTTAAASTLATGTLTLTISGSNIQLASSGAATGTTKVSFLGGICTLATSSPYQCTIPIPSGVSFTSSWTASGSVASQAASQQQYVTVTPSTGSFSLAPSNILQLTLGLVTSQTLTKNNQYTVQVVAADGSSTSTSLKAS
jgi:flagellin-like protein